MGAERRHQIFVEGDDLYADMLEGIGAARERVWMESYIFAADRVGRRLGPAAVRGAGVRPRRGWRRVVGSPEPLEILDGPAIAALVAAGFVVVANGGGGIPVVRTPAGEVHGVEAVIDKDLGAALLGRSLSADVLVIATDVDHAVLRFGTPDAEPLGTVDVATMRRYADDGHFAGGSMGPKVEACCRFVENGGRRAVITSLERIADAVRDEAGTAVVPG
jgi:carbamate kinase